MSLQKATATNQLLEAETKLEKKMSDHEELQKSTKTVQDELEATKKELESKKQEIEVRKKKKVKRPVRDSNP